MSKTMANYKPLCLFVLYLVFLPSKGVDGAQPSAKSKQENSGLRLFNTDVFGKKANEPVLLLRNAEKSQIDPETVMVDLEKGVYYAATVRCPKSISFADARKSLNKVYRKYEKESFANDPTMGLWRNNKDHLSIQLTEDDDCIQVIYINFTRLTDEKVKEALGRAFRNEFGKKADH
jgi:hypothetical protein